MRVLHVYKTYYPDTFGGIEQVIFQLAQGLGAHGIHSQVLTVSPHAIPADIPIGTHSVHRSRTAFSAASTPLSLAFIGDLKHLSAQVDLVHYQFPWPMMDVAQRWIGGTTPYLVSYQSDIVRQRALMPLYGPWMHGFLKRARCIIATSPAYVASSPVLQRYRDKVKIIPIGIDDSLMPPDNEARRTHWHQEIGGRYLLFVGVLRYYKGLHILLEALRGTTMRLVIAGAGPMEAALRRQAATLAAGQIRFVGAVDDADKAVLFQHCVAVAFPSHLRSEAFGISLVEGASFSRPLVSCEIGTGTSFINLHQQTGIVVPPDNAPALRQALQSLWSDTAWAEQLGQQARQRYEQLFQARFMVQQHAALYRQTLSNAAHFFPEPA